jgi:hypothetical protein
MKIWIGQPHMIKKIENAFGEVVKRNQSYKMLGTPHHHIIKPTKETGKLTDEEQKLYQMGVRMLLYFVKYSWPDISNAVRELSKGMKEATPDEANERVETSGQVCIIYKEFGFANGTNAC